MSDKAIPHPSSHQSLSPTRGKLDLIHDKVKKKPSVPEGRTESKKKQKEKETKGKKSSLYTTSINRSMIRNNNSDMASIHSSQNPLYPRFKAGLFVHDYYGVR